MVIGFGVLALVVIALARGPPGLPNLPPRCSRSGYGTRGGRRGDDRGQVRHLTAKRGPGLPPLALPFTLIHPSAWKSNSENFAQSAFSVVALPVVSCSVHRIPLAPASSASSRTPATT